MQKIILAVYKEPTDSLRAVVTKLQSAEPRLFKGLNESTMRGWFERTGDMAAPFKLKDQAQVRLKMSLKCRGGRGQHTLAIFKQVCSCHS